METPASLYAVRVPTAKGKRRLNGTEMALAALIYSHARADHAVPVCTRPIALVARMLGYTRGNVQEASRVLEAAGYWRRVKFGSVWRWEILILPSAAGHRWTDTVPQGAPDGGRPDQEVPQSGCAPPGVQVPQSGDPPIGVHVPQSEAPQSGYMYPDQGVERYPNRGTQHQQLIREEASASAADKARNERAAAIDAQTERYELAKREHPPARMGEGVAGTLETATLRERFVGILERFPAGSPERTRLAACRLATPIPEVLRRTCEDMGGLERVADVLAWAWTEHAHGRLGSLGKADPAVALRDAFRGEGRWWPGILDAYTRRPGEQRSLAWRPPDVGDEPRASAEFLNASMERFR